MKPLIIVAALGLAIATPLAVHLVKQFRDTPAALDVPMQPVAPLAKDEPVAMPPIPKFTPLEDDSEKRPAAVDEETLRYEKAKLREEVAASQRQREVQSKADWARNYVAQRRAEDIQSLKDKIKAGGQPGAIFVFERDRQEVLRAENERLKKLEKDQ